jgi:hypothetical protein
MVGHLPCNRLAPAFVDPPRRSANVEAWLPGAALMGLERLFGDRADRGRGRTRMRGINDAAERFIDAGRVGADDP